MEQESDDDRNELPGFGLPIDYLPKWSLRGDIKRFPHAIADDLSSKGVTVRERRMLEFINQVTDKPEWDRKVFDESIVSKWHDEACQRTEELNDLYLSERMFDFVCTVCARLAVRD